MSEFQFTLILPAAGSGSRIGSETPKPYLSIAGKPILEHTLDRFVSFDSLHQVVVSTSPEYYRITEQILGRLPGRIRHEVVEGGQERQDSVSHALGKVDPSSELIAIHDSVRPFVTKEEIDRCLNAAFRSGAAIAGIPVRDTIKAVDADRIIRETPDRKKLYQAQTPQVFRRKWIIEAYGEAMSQSFVGTDDASLVEHIGRDVQVVEGSYENLKITFPLDLKLAKLILES